MNKQISYITAGDLSFKESLLDLLLAKGYYRMQHLMFTCNDTIINEEDGLIPVFWLRTLVDKVSLNKKAQGIIKKCAGFIVTIQPANIDQEIEALHGLYKNHVPFSVSASCKSYLHQEILPDPFEGMMVQVHDKDKLIACGYFDKGLQSIAGLLNIYHPEYYKYSLGKYLMLQKLGYAMKQQMLYYYTGYISTASKRFDYKIFPDADAVEVLLPLEQKWINWNLIDRNFLNNYYLNYMA